MAFLFHLPTILFFSVLTLVVNSAMSPRAEIFWIETKLRSFESDCSSYYLGDFSAMQCGTLVLVEKIGKLHVSIGSVISKVCNTVPDGFN